MIRGPGDDCGDEIETDGMSIKAGDLLGGQSDHCLGVMRLRQGRQRAFRGGCALQKSQVSVKATR